MSMSMSYPGCLRPDSSGSPAGSDSPGKILEILIANGAF